VNRPRLTGTYGILSVGVLSSSVALISSSLDRFMFYILSSGSILLAILIASASLDVMFKGIAWMCGRAREHEAASTNPKSPIAVGTD
jgi:hypothetical protein